jgi:hypothetical protein
MMTEEDEQRVMEMSGDIDNFFEQYLIEHQELPLLHFFSIVLARMTAISNATGTDAVYKRLLQEVLKIMEMKETANTSGNYH